MYLAQLTSDKGKSFACHPIYHAEKMGSLAPLFVASKASTDVDKRMRGIQRSILAIPVERKSGEGGRSRTFLTTGSYLRVGDGEEKRRKECLRVIKGTRGNRLNVG